MLFKFRLELFHTAAVAQHVFRGEQLVQRFDSRFALGDLGFDFGDFAIRVLALAAFFGGFGISSMVTRNSGGRFASGCWIGEAA